MTTEHIKEIYFAGGCFWGIEAFMKKLPGVGHTDVGYANGDTCNPGYKDVCSGNTGHAESVHVSYDSAVIHLEILLKAFFKVIDPTSLNKQGNDRGSQYRTGIYYVDEADRETIEKAVSNEQKRYKKTIVTEVLPLKNYWPAESYHQDYLGTNPDGYCHIHLTDADAFIKENGLDQQKQSS